MMADRAFSLIEVVVALLLISMIGVAVMDTLLRAQRAQLDAGRWMQAIALAQAGLDRGRAGSASGNDTVGLFRRRWSSSTASDELGLRRIDVVVEWDTPSPQRFALSTLVRQ